MNEPKIDINKEYETLRIEIQNGKKYVFERPILILIGCFALLKLIEIEFFIYLPVIIIALLFFNLWFTVNRMRSMARIITYIQLVHENGCKWFGWETSLRKYRIWRKINERKDIKINNNAVYDNMGFYSTILFLHFVVNLTLTILLFFYVFLNNLVTFNNISILLITSVLLVFFIIYSIINSPARIKVQLEENIIIWVNVFEQWDKLDKLVLNKRFVNKKK